MKKTRDPIRVTSAIIAVTGVILYVIALFFQSLAIWAMTKGATDVLEETTWLLPCWIVSLALIPIAAVLNVILKKKENWPLLALVAAAAGTVLALMVALALKDALPVKAGNSVSIGYEQGLDTWKLIYRHLSSVFAGGLLMIAAAINHGVSRNDRIRLENEQYVDRYDLSGEPLFSDKGESTIGLDSYAESITVGPKNRKMKRSQKATAKKAKK